MNCALKLANLGRTIALTISVAASLQASAGDWVVYEGKEGPGKGKHIVLLAGDEEYRSEESLPMLGKLLSQRHGFKCTVLFAINPADGTIDPTTTTNVPGMEQIDTADLVVCQFRWRELPDRDMKHFVDYAQAGKPMFAIRTATHPFQYVRNKQSPYARFDWNNKEFPGGFGQQVLGDTWVSHHGNHGSESTRGLINGPYSTHPILRGAKDIWGATDVYGIVHLKPTDTVLVYGLTLKGMAPDSPPNYEKTIMPLIWSRDYTWDNGKTTRSVTSTIGAAEELQGEDLRRLFVNVCFWLTGLEVPAKADVSLVGEYKTTHFGFGKFKKGVKPAEHELR